MQILQVSSLLSHEGCCACSEVKTIKLIAPLIHFVGSRWTFTAHPGERVDLLPFNFSDQKAWAHTVQDDNGILRH